ncbi:MAG: hypothetical protein C5B54_05875, partial [Acidobacteria bacterium]
DGKWIVYDVHTPPERSAGSELEQEPRFLPNGTPGTFVGSHLLLSDTQGNGVSEICPAKGNCWRASWSPDSSRVAFYSDADGIPQIWMYDLKLKASKKISAAKIKAKLWLGDEAYWCSDGKKVFVPLAPSITRKTEAPSAAVGPKDSGIQIYSSGKESSEPAKSEPVQDYTEFFLSENNATLASIDVASGMVKEIVPSTTEPRPSCLTLSPSGKWIVYLSVYRLNDPASTKAFYDLAIVPAEGGPVHVIAKDLEVNDNDYYTLAYRWRPSHDQLVYYKNARLWWLDLNEKAAEPKQIAAELGDVAPFPILFTRDGNRLIIGTQPVDRKDYSGFWPSSLAIFSLETNTIHRMQFDPSLQYDQVLTSSKNIAWEPAENEFGSIWRNSESGEKSIFRNNLESGKGTTSKKELGHFQSIGAAGQDTMFVAYEDAATPPDIYQINHNLQRQKRISNIEPRFDNVRLGSVERFQTEIKEKDGKKITAQTAVILPTGTKKGDKLPTLVFHYAGLPLSRSADRFLAGSPASVPISVFVTRGYAALLTDLMIGPEGVPGNPAQEMVDLLLPQVNRAAELGYTDINRVGLIGQSYGGYSTAAIITKTNLFRAAVAISGVYDLPGTYAWMLNGLTPHINWSEQGQGRMGTHPWKDLTRYIENSPYYQADKIQTPLLLIHGGNDDTSPVQDAEKMFVALQRLNKTAQLAVYDKEGHTINTWSLEKAVDATQRILDFLARYIPVKS